RYPMAGVIWQLLHHLLGLRALGFDVYYIEDHRARVYDPAINDANPDPTANLKLLNRVLERYGFGDRWAFLDSTREEYLGMPREKCMALFREADAVINLCGATEAREEHLATPCFIYIETDPGVLELELLRKIPTALEIARAHKLFFTYGFNIGEPDCLLPTGGIHWRHTRPPVMLDEWHPGIGLAEPRALTTVGNWRNHGSDMVIKGETYFWSKHINFRKLLGVARLANQPIEIATGEVPSPDYENGIAGGFSFTRAIPMSLDIDRYRDYISSSRGEFTAAKDLYVRPRTGWFSDRSACYLAAGRPVITQSTGFEKFLRTGEGLLGFADSDGAVEAIRMVNSDYARHARAAREIAVEYFDAVRLLGEIAAAAGV
ncbi:MAG TPA: glycosyltransferase, partial [Candidatus Binataceae bacterium]|nr:glycosyltransferase [Candidatus Binataceae bacterium]